MAAEDGREGGELVITSSLSSTAAISATEDMTASILSSLSADDSGWAMPAAKAAAACRNISGESDESGGHVAVLLSPAEAAVEALAAEADALHLKAQALNKTGAYAEAVDAYAAFVRKDQESVDAAVALPRPPPDEEIRARCYTSSPFSKWRSSSSSSSSPASFSSSQSSKLSSGDKGSSRSRTPQALDSVRARCVGAIVGAIVADAAAMGVQWIYDPEELERRHAACLAAGHLGLDFHDPPASPHFDYESGRNSPYGEQSLVLLESLAEHGCLDTAAYADAFGGLFGAGWRGYRDASCKGFLRRWATGAMPPATGADDFQINCVVRLPSLITAFGGVGRCGGGGKNSKNNNQELREAVVAATRVTQNTPRAVAWALMMTDVLEPMIYEGMSPARAVQQGATRALRAERDFLTASEAVASHWYEAGGHLMYKVVPKVETGHAAVVAKLGKNCHIPNSCQTPVHVVLHHIDMAKENGHRGGGGEGAASAAAAEEEEEEEEERGEERGEDGIGMEETKEELKFRSQLSDSKEARQALFAGAIRDAIRQGGCCGSRAGVAGGLLGAYLGGLCGDLSFLPPEWVKKTTAFDKALACAEAICDARQTPVA